DANVKVGTVLDPDLDGELRVTVVATGLQREPVRLAVENIRGQRVVNADNFPRTPNDWRNLDKPTGARQAEHQPATMAPTPNRASGVQDYSNLDIPAFLRRQAD
ncbi:MAG: cell division protein FtsZ, partial [Acidithiobacillus sp.]